MDNETVERLGVAMARVVADYDEWRSPFSDRGAIPSRITTDETSRRDASLYATVLATVDRNGTGGRIDATVERLWADDPWIFRPERLVSAGRFDELATVFGDANGPLDDRDARNWFVVARSLTEDYGGDPRGLFASFDFDANRVRRHLDRARGETCNSDEVPPFPGLDRAERRSTWFRLVHDYVHPLSGWSRHAVAVDGHVIRTTNRVLGTEFTSTVTDRALIRQCWRDVCTSGSLDPGLVDRALWYVDRYWNTWGRPYFLAHLRNAGLCSDADRIEPGSADRGATGSAPAEPTVGRCETRLPRPGDGNRGGHGTLSRKTDDRSSPDPDVDLVDVGNG